MTLAQVRAYVLSLQESTEEPHFDRTSFRVRGKIFATARPKEPHIHVFVDEMEREWAVALYPDYIEKLWWGKKVVGVRVVLRAANAPVVKDLLRSSWMRKAPDCALAGNARWLVSLVGELRILRGTSG